MMIPVTINKNEIVNALIDTGGSNSIIDINVVRGMNLDINKKEKDKFTTVGENYPKVPTYGTVNIEIIFNVNKKSIIHKFHVFDGGDDKIIIGRDLLLKIKTHINLTDKPIVTYEAFPDTPMKLKFSEKINPEKF